jgi:hypothetical protein
VEHRQQKGIAEIVGKLFHEGEEQLDLFCGY